MKNKMLTVVVFGAIIAAVTMTGLAAFAGRIPEENAAVQQVSPKFMLKEYNGVIAVFLEDGTPAVETGIAVSQLREFDRLLLEQGIEAESYEELLSLLEDFGS